MSRNLFLLTLTAPIHCIQVHQQTAFFSNAVNHANATLNSAGVQALIPAGSGLGGALAPAAKYVMSKVGSLGVTHALAAGAVAVGVGNRLYNATISENVKRMASEAAPHWGRASTLVKVPAAITTAGTVAAAAFGSSAIAASAAAAAAAVSPVAGLAAAGYLAKGAYQAYQTTKPEGKYAIAKREHLLPLTAMRRSDTIDEVNHEMKDEVAVFQDLASNPQDAFLEKVTQVATSDLVNLKDINTAEVLLKAKDSPDEPIQSRDRALRFLETPQ